MATGVKVANPDLSVWVVTGDGDGLSIGGNHLLHILRRNIDITIILFNNRIYGLTKGQYSPTSETGKITKSSPMGTLESPIDLVCFAIAAEATFVARGVDTNINQMITLFKAAAAHKGASFIEIFQNCVIFNNKTHDIIASRNVREERLLMLEDGKPLIFGKEKNKGISLKGLKPQTIKIWNTIGDAINKMATGHFRHLPVLGYSDKIGLISVKGIMSFINDRLLP